MVPKARFVASQCDQKKSPNFYKSCPKMISLEKELICPEASKICPSRFKISPNTQKRQKLPKTITFLPNLSTLVEMLVVITYK